MIQGKFLAPLIYNKTVHIHPALVLIALPAGAAVAGIIGLFAAIPVVAFALAIVGALVSILGVEPQTAVSSDEMVPIWLDRLGQWSWRLLVSIGLLAVGVGVIEAIPIVVIPLVLGLVMAATLAPLGSALERRGWSHTRAALGATLGAAAGMVAHRRVDPRVAGQPASDMISSAAEGPDGELDAGGNAGTWSTLVQTFGIGILATIAGVLSSLSGITIVLLLATLLTFYFMRDGEAFWRRFLERVEPGRRSQVDAAGSRAFNVLGGYMIGTGAISIFGAATQFLIMTILGYPVRPAPGGAGLLRRVHPVHRVADHDRAGVPRDGGDRDAAGRRDHGHVHDRVQHRPGQHRGALVYSRVVSIHPAVVLVAIPAGNAVAGIIGMFLVVPFLGRRGGGLADRPARARHRTGRARGAAAATDARAARGVRRAGPQRRPIEHLTQSPAPDSQRRDRTRLSGPDRVV